MSDKNKINKVNSLSDIRLLDIETVITLDDVNIKKGCMLEGIEFKVRI